MKTVSSRGYSTSLAKTTISSALRIASRETASSGPSTTASSRSSSTTLSTVHRIRSRCRPICAHDEARQQGARSSPTGGGVRRPRDGRRTSAALRGGSSERSDALAPTYGALHELAHAFSLKSTSKGNGAARFTKLVKTMLSGLRADEWNVGRIWSSRRHMDAVQGKRKGKAGRMKTTRKMAKS